MQQNSWSVFCGLRLALRVLVQSDHRPLFWCFALCVLWSGHALGAEPVGEPGAEHELRGRIELWEREACLATSANCSVPVPLNIGWDLAGSIRRPQSTGDTGPSISFWSQEFREGIWLARVLVVWKSAFAGVPEHLVVQTQLFQDVLGLVAECSRYDGPSDFFPLPPGACSGILGGKQIGISLMRSR